MTDRLINIISIICFVAILAIPTFQRDKIQIEPDSGVVYAVKITWWGLKQDKREIKWGKAEGYDYAAWCTKDRNGEWYPYIIDPDSPEYEMDLPY